MEDAGKTVVSLPSTIPYHELSSAIFSTGRERSRGFAPIMEHVIERRYRRGGIETAIGPDPISESSIGVWTYKEIHMRSRTLFAALMLATGLHANTYGQADITIVNRSRDKAGTDLEILNNTSREVPDFAIAIQLDDEWRVLPPPPIGWRLYSGDKSRPSGIFRSKLVSIEEAESFVGLDSGEAFYNYCRDGTLIRWTGLDYPVQTASIISLTTGDTLYQCYLDETRLQEALTFGGNALAYLECNLGSVSARSALLYMEPGEAKPRLLVERSGEISRITGTTSSDRNYVLYKYEPAHAPKTECAVRDRRRAARVQNIVLLDVQSGQSTDLELPATSDLIAANEGFLAVARDAVEHYSIDESGIRRSWRHPIEEPFSYAANSRDRSLFAFITGNYPTPGPCRYRILVLDGLDGSERFRIETESSVCDLYVYFQGTDSLHLVDHGNFTTSIYFLPERER